MIYSYTLPRIGRIKNYPSGHGLVVERVLAKDETGFRLPLAAPNPMKNEIHREITKSMVPPQVLRVTDTLEDAGFQAFIVGGCVRDLFLGRTPKDWDVTTNAKPDQIQALFPKTVYENKFGTVAVVWEDEATDSPFRIVEVTPFRKDGAYSDFRHPDQVQFAESIEEDLARRDFTINAIAARFPKGNSKDISETSKGQIADLHDGIRDLQEKTIKTVGNAKDRFTEDALRMVRAVRFATELDFAVSHETTEAIVSCETLVKHVSFERIRDEFVKIVNSPNPAQGIMFLVKLGLAKHFLPELIEGVGCDQKGIHIYDVFEHLLHAIQHAADKKYPFHVKLAALFHDIGKPRTRRIAGKTTKGPGIQYTFYGHEVVGAKMTKKILERMKFSRETTEIVTKLVRWHMFFSDPDQITLSAVRRLVAHMSEIGPTSRPGESGAPQDKLEDSSNHPIWTLMKVRECDRVGMKKNEAPYRLRKYHAMIEQVLRDPISVKQLKINGNYLMEVLHMKPGPRMGWILNTLLEEVLEDPSKNTIETLVSRVTEIEKLSDADLKTLGEAGKKAREEADEAEIEMLHMKHGVK